jgi:hypothetical protein
MTDIENPELPAIDAAKEQNVTPEDWGFDAEAFAEQVEAEEPIDDAGDEAGELEEEQEELELADDAEELGEEEAQPEEPKKRGKNANARISDLTKKLKESVSKEEYNALKKEMDNLKAGLDYLKPREEAVVKSLDDRLVEAARAVGDPEFNLDDFTTDAEKRAALLGYENRIESRQRAQEAALGGVKASYSNVIAEYQTKDPELANGLIAAYNAAVRDEARALQRRYDNLTPQEAHQHAERILLQEAAGKPDPVYFIASFGKQILDDAGHVLTKPKEKVKIDHKNRETVQQRAGRPEIETAPTTKRSVELAKKYAQVAAEW